MDKNGVYEVRPAKAGDEAGWRRLWQCYCDFYQVQVRAEVTNLLWQRIMDSQSEIHALAAESLSRDGRRNLIGIANYVLHPYTWGSEQICYLEDLFVLEDARGSGVGRALIEALIKTAKSQGWARVYWHTHELNEPARSLYDKITPRDPFVRYVVRVA
jgi:GNAT superfamily N-acetyltransferase